MKIKDIKTSTRCMSRLHAPVPDTPECKGEILIIQCEKPAGHTSGHAFSGNLVWSLTEEEIQELHKK